VKTRRVSPQANLARALKGAAKAGMNVTRAEYDPLTGKVLMFFGPDEKSEATPSVSTAAGWRARRAR
jgi:hypothetical protein